MSHDAATSMRREKPHLFARLDIAIAQSGVKGINSDKAYALTCWSLDQGRRLPWYFKREPQILAVEGGRDEAILTVAGAALGLMQRAEWVATVTDGDLFAAACYQAGKDWRNDLRRQWGDTGRARSEWQDPIRFSEIEHKNEGWMQKADNPVEDWIAEHAIELAGPTPEFDPTDIQDPRLRKLWASLTDKERQALMLRADGYTKQAIAERLDVGLGAVQYRLRQAIAKGAAV